MAGVRVAAERAVDQVATRRAAVLNALDQVTRSSVFRASGRSQEFLRYVVETALDRNFESLKERVIGSALFGRAPDYDTGSDAIVRVVALHSLESGPDGSHPRDAVWQVTYPHDSAKGSLASSRIAA